MNADALRNLHGERHGLCPYFEKVGSHFYMRRRQDHNRLRRREFSERRYLISRTISLKKEFSQKLRSTATRQSPWRHLRRNRPCRKGRPGYVGSRRERHNRFGGRATAYGGGSRGRKGIRRAGTRRGARPCVALPAQSAPRRRKRSILSKRRRRNQKTSPSKKPESLERTQSPKIENAT